MASRPAWINVGGTDSVGSASITAADDLITVATHGLADGDLVAFDTLAAGADGPLVEDAPYYVRDAATDTFRVSGSPGGERVEFDSDGTAEVYTAVPSYSAEELRQIGSHDLFHGAADRLGARQGVRPGGGDPVSVAGTTWTVHDHTGVVDQSETSTQGPYKYVQLEQSASLDPADGSNDRYDGLDLLVEDDDVVPSGHRRSRIVYVAGTPGDGEPDVTSGANRIAVILVPAGGSPTPSVDSLAEWTVSSGAVLPIRDATERPANPYEGMTAFRLDTGAVEVYHDGAWGTAGSVRGYQFGGTVVYTSSGSFTKANYPGLRAVEVECIGGGGGGGGAVTTSSSQASSGSGGNGANWAKSFLLVSALSSTETVTVGNAGAGGTGNGSTGGNSSFGSLVVGGGGAGGIAASASVGRGGADASFTSGTATGDETAFGDSGEGSWQSGDDDMAWAGKGGSAARGGGGGRGRRSSTSLSGGAGKFPGGAGGGAANGNSEGNAQSGASGAAGYVVVRLYY